MKWHILVFSCLAFLSGCSSEQADSVTPGSRSETATGVANRGSGVVPLASLTPNQIAESDLSILFIGNSHSAPMPEYVARIASRHRPGRRVLCSVVEAHGFLIEHMKRKKTLDAITLGPWDYVVLQAQKYSTSGRYKYGHEGAVALTKLASENGSKVVMYPEWGQHGNTTEGRRVHELHENIASLTGAMVAPVGLAWDAALDRQPDLQLHAPDGNHAGELGNHLTAAVLYARIIGEDFRKPDRASEPTPEMLLEDVANETVSDYAESLKKRTTTAPNDHASDKTP